MKSEGLLALHDFSAHSCFAPRLERVAGQRPKQIEDRTHRVVGSCADSALSDESVRI
jgi:hypothetical protein